MKSSCRAIQRKWKCVRDLKIWTELQWMSVRQEGKIFYFVHISAEIRRFEYTMKFFNIIQMHSLVACSSVDNLIRLYKYTNRRNILHLSNKISPSQQI